MTLALVLLAGTLLALVPTNPAAESPDPGPGDYTLTSRTIWSYYTETPPSLDDPTDTVWDYPLEVLGLVPGHIALSGGTSLEIRSVYTDTDVYFRILWNDVVENSDAPTWTYHNDNWTFSSPFEDGLGLYFPITDPDDLFLEEGCMRTCHMTDWENPKNQERKFTYTEEETGDLWFWSSGITNPWDFALDAYVNDKPSANNVGYYEDPEMDLGLIKNRHLTEYMEYVYLSRPVYMQDPNIEPRYGPEFIISGEEVLFDQNLYDPDLGESGINPITHEPWRNGDVVGGYILDHLPQQGLGQIDAKGSYDVIDQQWSLVMKRPLDTGDPVHDVIFRDLTRTYPFGVSLFGDIMGGGDVTDPFQEPEDRCVMNKVTPVIGLRFRPVVRAEHAHDSTVSEWDGAAWAQGSTRYLHELIHRSGEIHDPWDWVNISAACDGEDYYLHLDYSDPNGSEELEVDLAWLTPGMVSVEETFHLLDWSDILGHMAVEEGSADVWNYRWNITSLPDGLATDLSVVDGVARVDASGPDDVTGWQWRDGTTHHIVLSRALDTGQGAEDVAFNDMARTYVMRLAMRTSDRDEWYITYPVSAGFASDLADTVPASPLTGVTVADGGDSDLVLGWDEATDADFGQYRVYVEDGPFSTLEGIVPKARISDASTTDLHLQGVRPGDYHVAVVAVDDNRNLPARVTPATVTVTDDTPPTPLADVKAFDNLDSDILVSWEPSASPDVDTYQVFLETSPFTATTYLEPRATAHGLRSGSMRIGGLEAGKAYHVAVVAVDWAGNSDRLVGSVSATPTDVTPPPEVRGLDASTPQQPESEGEVLLKWSSVSAEDLSGYNVYISLTPITSLQNFAPWGKVGADEASVVVDGLRPGTTYHLAVTALDRSGHEGLSKYTVSAVASTADPPGTVRGLVAVQAGEDSVRLTWTAVNRTGSPLARYRVYVSDLPITSLTSEGVRPAGNVTPSDSPSLLVTGLDPGGTYYFAVVAEDDKGRTGNGSPQVASVTLYESKEEGPSTWELVGPPLAMFMAMLLVVLVAYVAVNRHRRYGRLLSRRPTWEKPKNGANGGR